jgi:hypothetical protein
MIRSPWRLAALAAAILTFAAAATASADTYTVFSCKGPTGVPNAAAGWAATPPPTGVGHVDNACANAGSLSASIDQDNAGTASASWAFTAPANTTIVRLAGQRHTTGIASGPARLSNDVDYILTSDANTLEDCSAALTSSCVADLTGAIDKQGLAARARAPCAPTSTPHRSGSRTLWPRR